MSEQDEQIFGKDTLVYCNQHLRPHSTGWCSVSVRNKIALAAKTIEDAYRECEQKGLELYNTPKVWHPAFKGVKNG